VIFSTILHPHDITILEERALEITRLRGLSPDDFYIYVHRMYITNGGKHFAHKMPVEDRIESLRLTFAVNQKQAKYGLIQFFNNHVSVDRNSPIGTATSLQRIYSGGLKSGEPLNTEIITYISKSLRRESHRKIKAKVEATSTQAFKELYQLDKQIMTEVDLRFDREVQLEINFSSTEMEDREVYFENILQEVRKLKAAVIRLKGSGVIAILDKVIRALENQERADALKLIQGFSEDIFDIALDNRCILIAAMKPGL